MAVDFSMRILVVDGSRDPIRSILTQLGFKNVVDASDGASALQVLRASPQPFGIVIKARWSLNDPAKGLNLLKTIRGDAKFRSIGFIAISDGVMSPADRDRTMQLGVNMFMESPVTSAKLKEAIIPIIGISF